MKLTIFTPTYNRAHTLRRLYESLNRQTDLDFEWLVIDDGSTDDTETLMETFLSQNPPFVVRYQKIDHRGKPFAQNLALDLANGDFFLTCDSNKYLDDRAVEQISMMQDSIANAPMICGVGGYRASFSGKIYGGEMTKSKDGYIDCSNNDRVKYNLLGDKSTAFRTEILRKYKSPIFPDETFVTEAVWLIPMACDGYIIRWFPQVLCYGEYDPDGLTAQGANSYRGHEQNYHGYLAYLKVALRAFGMVNMKSELIEAIKIAKAKHISLTAVAEEIGCDCKQLYYIWIRHICGNFYRRYLRRAH